MPQPTFTLAIVNWNTRDLLDRCLRSIREVKGGVSVQTLVADNASEDGSLEMAAARYPEVELTRNRENLGFARGHEPLFHSSQGRFHVLVNSDVELLPGCLEKVAERMDGDPEIGVLGCQVIGPDGRIQPSCRRFPSLWRQLLDASGLNRAFPRSRFFNGYKMGDFDHRQSREVDQVMGSFFVIRRDLMDKIGFLDTGFFMYYEEVDYCRRCRDAGYKVFFEAGAQVRHEGGGSARKVKVLTIRRAMRSMRRYFRKHLGGWTYGPLLLILSLDAATHALYALAANRQPWQTLKAYVLGWWDVLTLKRADF